MFIGGTLTGQLCFSNPLVDVDSGPILSIDQNDVRYSCDALSERAAAPAFSQSYLPNRTCTA